jgi:carboxypeptidase A4
LCALTTQGIEATAAVHGEIYTVISVTAQFGKASGGSVDYALGTALAKYSLAHELRDTGRFGFVLPPEYIVPTGEEIWAFHVAVARELINEYVP